MPCLAVSFTLLLHPVRAFVLRCSARMHFITALYRIYHMGKSMVCDGCERTLSMIYVYHVRIMCLAG